MSQEPVEFIVPNPSDEAARRAAGVQYLKVWLCLDTDEQAEELYAVVENNGMGLARQTIWTEARKLAIAGGYMDKLDYDKYVRQFVDLFKAQFWNDPRRDSASAIGKTRI